MATYMEVITNNVIATYIQKLQLSIIISAICSYYIVIC